MLLDTIKLFFLHIDFINYQRHFLQEIQEFIMVRKLEAPNYLPLALCEANINLYECRQGTNETCEAYLARFESNAQALKRLGGRNFGEEMSLVHFEMKEGHVRVFKDIHRPGNYTYDKYIEMAVERYNAALFLENADDDRFGQLKRESIIFK